MFKENRMMLHKDTCIFSDKAYRGIHKIHFMNLIPINAFQNHPLTDIEHAFNASLARERIFIKHIKNVSAFFLYNIETNAEDLHSGFLSFVLFIIYNITNNFFMIEGFRTGLM